MSDHPSIAWEDPPPQRESRKRKESKWAPYARMMKQQPGRWAKLVEHSEIGVVTGIKHGHIVAFRPPEAWEVRIVLDDGKRWIGTVWVRYIGENGEFK